MPKITRLLIAVPLLAMLAWAPPATATVYEVGPGRDLEAIGEVPWQSLVPGDHVRIHWRAEPYREKWVIGRRGSAEAPIVVEGVAGPSGQRPVIDGNGATTPAALNFWNEDRGVIKIGGSNSPPDTLPAYIHLVGLQIRSGRPPYSFTDDGGSTRNYSNNAAAVYVEKAEYLEIRDCVLRDSGNGLFVGAYGGDTRHVLIEGNWIHENGNVGRIYEHNTYTAAIDVIYQFNHMGPLRSGAQGNNLKDRSAGLVVRYNWIENGNRQLDLVDAEDSQVLVNHPSYDETHVYGNVLIEADGEGNSQMVHYGGDSGTTDDYRKGTLYFYNNTVVSTRTGNTTLLRLSTNDEHADVRNNIVYVTAPGSRLALLSSSGSLALDHNWFKAGYVTSHDSFGGSLTDLDSIEGSTPGFLDEAGQDFQLVPDSDAVDAGTTLHPGVPPEHAPVRHYVKHQSSETRPTVGPLDLGAFEACDCIFSDGFEFGDRLAWSPS